MQIYTEKQPILGVTKNKQKIFANWNDAVKFIHEQMITREWKKIKLKKKIANANKLDKLIAEKQDLIAIKTHITNPSKQMTS